MQWSAAIAFPRDRTALRDDVDHALSGLGTSINALAVKYGFPAAASRRRRPTAPESTARRRETSQAPAPTAAASNADDIAAGQKLFNENCAHCHGPTPFKASSAATYGCCGNVTATTCLKTFIYTVTHGRVSKGMPNWSGIITMDEFQKILAFLTSVQEPAP